MIPRTKKSVISDNDIMMYAGLAMKHIRLMVLLVCFSLMLGLTYFTYARSVYYAKARVEMQKVERPLDTEKVFGDSSDKTIRKEIVAEHIWLRTAKRLGINSSSKRELMRKFMRKIFVSYDSEHNLIIEVWPYSAELAARWPETMVQEYLAWRSERRLDLMANTFREFSEDMALYKQRMDQVADEQFGFTKSNELTKIVIELNQFKEVPRRIQMIKKQLAIMERTREMLENTNRDAVARLSLLFGCERERDTVKLSGQQFISEIHVGQTIPRDDATGVVVMPSTVSSPLKQPWEEYEMRSADLRRQYEDTGRKYGSGHPRMTAIKKQLDSVNKSLDVQLASDLNRFNLEYRSLLDQQRIEEAKIPQYDEMMKRHEKTLKEYSLIDAGHQPWASYNNRMTRQMEALTVAVDNERAQMQFKELLDVRTSPVSPNRFKLVIYAFLFGLALAIAVPFFIEYVDSRVSDVEQVEESLRIRSLGVVPKVTGTPIDQVILAHADSKKDVHIHENFRLIRTNLVMNSASPALPQVILVTSAMPQEGKTIVAANLAASFAKKGEKTLLIDADLRRGRLHRLFACQNRPGLTEMLTHNKPLEEICRVVGNGTTNGNLTLMTCGKHIHFASELLDTAAFPKLIDDLRQKYQRIVIDTPPVLGLSETSIIQRTADGVVLVIWSDYTPLRNVKTAIQTLQTNGAKFAGFVLNRLDFAALTNRYKYFYYSPYYYASYRPHESGGPPPPPQLTPAEN